MPSISIIGFDSAWTDKPTAPGAACVVRLRNGSAEFDAPRLVSFAGALDVVDRERALADLCLVAIDQPTIVPNLTSMRPVERAAASLISWLGGGVQPANRSKRGMFDDDAPIWRFKTQLAASDDAEEARTAVSGTFLIEVFPALALVALESRFFGRLAAPRYNPVRRRTYRSSDWILVAEAVAVFADKLGVVGAAAWCRQRSELTSPTKADQDKLDSVICALVALNWRVGDRASSVVIGDLDAGYMVAPFAEEPTLMLREAARRCAVRVDGSLVDLD